MRDWLAADRRRLDQIRVTPALEDKLSGARIVKDARGREMPSDHEPVAVDIAV